jgi:hypothetical protein
MRPILYLKLRCDHMHLSHLQSGRDVHIRAPFSNSRMLVADFSAAQKLLSSAIDTLLPKRFLRLSIPPSLLIQPLERLEGGLSQIEERILLEVGHSAGTRKVVVHVGDELDNAGVNARLKN